MVTLLCLGSAAAVGGVSDEYGVGTSYNVYFAGLAGKLPAGTHYAYYRSGQYEYTFVYSEDLQVDGDTFTADSAVVAVLDTESGYQSPPTWSTYETTDIRFSANGNLIYSDLGDYPDLIERREVQYAELTVVILCSFAVWTLLDRMVRACKRSR